MYILYKLYHVDIISTIKWLIIDRPFQCEHCNKGFALNTTLRLHLKSHGINVSVRTPRLPRSKREQFSSSVTQNERHSSWKLQKLYPRVGHAANTKFNSSFFSNIKLWWNGSRYVIIIIGPKCQHSKIQILSFVLVHTFINSE